MAERSTVKNSELILAYRELGSVAAVGRKFGLNGSSVHERLKKLGVTRAPNVFRPEEVERLKREYQAAADAGKLEELAASMGRTKQFICRQAGAMGLTNSSRPKPYLAPALSKRAKAWHAENEHPRGALGMKHTAEAKSRISEKAKRMWDGMSEAERADMNLRGMKTKAAKYGSVAPKMGRGSWKAAWHEVGGQRIYFRSRWEANYARYLEWLRAHGQIAFWEHEPETFWFESIKRGIRSYLPDFKVTENGGSVAYHEVKGWMDSRSRTTISRFRKYYPQNTLIVIDTKAYEAIARKMGAVIEGWE